MSTIKNLASVPTYLRGQVAKHPTIREVVEVRTRGEFVGVVADYGKSPSYTGGRWVTVYFGGTEVVSQEGDQVGELLSELEAENEAEHDRYEQSLFDSLMGDYGDGDPADLM